MSNRISGLANTVVFVAALLFAAPAARATTALPPTWKVNVTADAAAKAAGRHDFVEYIVIEASSFTGEQICRLGMEQTALNVTARRAGRHLQRDLHDEEQHLRHRQLHRHHQ